MKSLFRCMGCAAFLVFAAPVAAADCESPAGSEALPAGGILVVGEYHGTVEPPEVFFNLVCDRLARAEGELVVVALELPEDLNPAFALLGSPAGAAAAKDAVSNNAFWERFGDGRRSAAMLLLTHRLVDLASQHPGRMVISGVERRPLDRLGSELLDELLTYHGTRNAVVLVGNAHARKVPMPQQSGPPFAARLQSMGHDLVSLNIAPGGGEGWFCTPDCASAALQDRDRGDTVFVALPQCNDEPCAWDGYYYVPSLTVSEPVHAAPAEPVDAKAAAGMFSPCADAADHPELAGSLCATTTVPLRHASPDGTSIELFVRRIPAPDQDQRRGEIWLVAGGPGEPGASFHPLLSTFRQAFPHHDLVLPDHRGTGGSERLCPQQESPDSADGVALAGEEWGPCIGAMHADVERTTAFTITEAAHDLSTLMDRFRGEGDVVLYGVSYGTQLALRMLQVAPPDLDGLILDGLVPPEGDARWDLSRRTAVVDEVGRRFLGEDGMAAYERLLETAEDDAAWRAHVPGGDLRRFFGALLNFPALRARIPAIIEALACDDETLLQATVSDLEATMAAMATHPMSPPSLPLVMLISSSENNERGDLSRETVEAEAQTALFTSPLPGLLVNSPVPRYERDAWFGKTPEVLPRTLVLHGTLDPNTPYEGAQAHARMLIEAGPVTFATVRDGAHLLAYVAPTCFVAAASAFVDGAPVPEECAEDTQ